MNKTSLKTILSNSTKDGFDCWPNKNKTNSAANRLDTQDFIKIKISPKFKLSSEEKIFTIGSCFARNIERKLVHNNIEVLSNKLTIPQHWIAHPQAKNNDILNKFNTHSMLAEIENTFYKNNNTNFIKVSEVEFYDPQTSYTTVLPYEECLKMRKRIQKVYEGLSRSTTVILTLGMTESWYDNKTNQYINGLPLPKVVRRNKSRFEFFNANVDQVKKSLVKTVSILKENCMPNLKIVLTVSPVPLRKTFTNKDIFVANTLSKSTLRIAANEIAEMYSFVDYFPSYEMVTSSPRDISWDEDTIHVSDELVGNITQYFISEYSR